MSALQTFVEQIEAYGVIYDEYRTPATNLLVKEYTIDSETLAMIVYDSDNVPKIAKFINQNNRT